MTLEDHPIASIFPLMRDDEIADLAEDIKANGLRESIWLYENKILDGRNRYRACELIGIEPTYQNYAQANPLAFVVSMNLHRRHLTKSQRAMIAERVANMQSGERTDLVQHCTRSLDDAAKMLNVSRRTVATARQVRREGSPELVAAVESGEKTITQAVREIREQRRGKRRDDNRAAVESISDPIEAVGGQLFSTIVIDPPWDWGDEGDVNQLGRAKPDYATKSIDELRALPVAMLADEDCHLYLWITNRSLPKGFGLIDAWGFRYITCLTWCKPHFGMGNYFRGSTEHLLFAIRGSQPLKRKDVGTWFQAERGKGGHSSKPEDAYNLIESCSPGPYLDMFSRRERPDWTCWGEVNLNVAV